MHHHHHHHRGSGGGAPAPPPPPVLTSRSSRVPTSRPSVRSRSRSRSPGLSRGASGSSSRFHSRGDRDGRDLRDRDRERERDRDRDRGRRSRSPSPYASSSRSDRDRDRKHPSSSSAGTSKGSLQPSSSTTLESLPSISLIQTDPAPSIIRRILNPEDVKIPRRVNEGSRPIFDRDELREAMLRRMRSNDNEENPPQPNAYIQEPTVAHQRVVAIIREPVGGADIYLASKDPAFHSVKLTSNSTASTGHLQPVSPEPVRSSYHRRASPGSPVTRSIRTSARHATPPPPPQITSRTRSLERERDARERLIIDREREQMQRVIEREREQIRGPPRERERIPDRLESDHHREREREKPSRFGPPPGIDQRQRSRSPVSRVLREDMRLRRRSRSHSVTPPPMPEEIRRQLIERQRHIDLRNSLSRQPGKYISPHDDRIKGRVGPPIRGGGRGRGGFLARGGSRAREDGRVWVHDMYEGEDEPKKGD